jgi:hypothetical protein
MEGNYQSFSSLNTEQILNLMKCMAICKACWRKCIEEDNKETAVLCAECAEVCDLALRLKCANSQFSNDMLKLCAEVCKRCGEACQRIEAQHCKECGDICNRCSATCSSQLAER